MTDQTLTVGRSWAKVTTFALSLFLVSTIAVSAATNRLQCLLTDTGTRPGSENRALVVEFDPNGKTLNAVANGQSYSFSTISISNVVLSGTTGDVSMAVDRSSYGIVWQQYGTSGVITEYGHCQRPQDSPAP